MKPTDAEMDILTVLWEKGPSTVRVVNEQLNQDRKVGYTNTLKMMQIMHEKGLLDRDETSRSHIYTTNLSEQKVQKDVVGNLIQQVFHGNATSLMVHALGNHTPSPEELREIRELIDKMEKGAGDE